MSSEASARESVAPLFLHRSVDRSRSTRNEQSHREASSLAPPRKTQQVHQFRTPLTTAKRFDEPQPKHGAQPLLSKAYSEKGKCTRTVGGPSLREDDLLGASSACKPQDLRKLGRPDFRLPHSNPPTQLLHRDCSDLADLPLTYCVHSRRPGSAANEAPLPGRI